MALWFHGDLGISLCFQIIVQTSNEKRHNNKIMSHSVTDAFISNFYRYDMLSW
jgi:hypothetical protein